MEYRDVKTILSYGDDEDMIYIEQLTRFLEWMKHILEMRLLKIGIINGFIYLNFHVSPKRCFLPILMNSSQ